MQQHNLSITSLTRIFVLFTMYLVSVRITLTCNLQNILQYKNTFPLGKWNSFAIYVTAVTHQAAEYHTLLLLDWLSFTEPPRLFLWWGNVGISSGSHAAEKHGVNISKICLKQHLNTDKCGTHHNKHFLFILVNLLINV